MKRVSLIIAAFLLAGMASAQDLGKKRFTKGFNFGVNQANVLLQDNSNGTYVQNGLGFRFGLISSLALSERYSWRLWLENGVKLNLGRDDIALRVQRFSKVADQSA